MSNKIAIGVLGCANIATKSLIPAICSVDRLELTGIASRDSETASSIASKFNTTPYTYQALIDSGELDAIYIPLPNALHYPWIIRSLETGLHVLVEKSLACTYQQVNELIDLAESKGLVLMESFQFRFHKQMRIVGDLIANGDLGKLRSLKSSFGFPPFPDKANIRYQAELGGGALLDAGAYPLRLAQIIMGNDTYVSDATLYFDDHLGVDLMGSAFLKNPRTDVVGFVEFGFNNFYQNSLDIWGSAGRLTSDRIFTAGPGVIPQVILSKPSQNISFENLEDDHFSGLLNAFVDLVENEDGRNDEASGNQVQARLLDEVRSRAR